MNHFQGLSFTEKERFGLHNKDKVQQENDSVEEKLCGCTITQEEGHDC